MNKIREHLRENLRFLLIFGVILAGLTVGLTIWLEDFIRSTVLRPLAYIRWMLGLILGTIPGRWYFTVVSFIVCLIAISALQNRRNRTTWEHTSRISLTPRIGLVSVWQRRLHNLEKGQYANVVFAENLSQLLIHLLMTQNRMSQRDIIEACEAKTLMIPEYVRTFILETIHHNTYGKARASWLERIWNDIKSFFTKTQSVQREGPAIDLEPILLFMESELNLVHANQITRRNA